MPTTLDTYANPLIWWTRNKFCTEYGIHSNTLAAAKLKGQIPEEDILLEHPHGHRWWIHKDTKWRPRGHGRPAHHSNRHLRRRCYYIRYIPECPDLRTIRKNSEQLAKWQNEIDRLCQLGPEAYLNEKDRKELL